MADNKSTTALKNALDRGVASYQVDGERADSYPLRDLVQADKYFSAKDKAETCGQWSMVRGMFGRIRPVR